MEKKEIYTIEELLPRYCDGDVTSEERLRVEKWMDESEEHRKIVRQIYMIHLTSDTISVMDRVHTDKALDKVNNRIRMQRMKVWLHYVEKVAAVLFLPLLGAYLFFPREAHKEARLLTVQTNPGMTTQVTLPDGSLVTLNSESSLTYPEFFDKDKRTVTLSGEAYFEVTKDPEHRFVVSAPHQTEVEVLGTSFNLEAFPQDSLISTTLQKGAVSFKYGEKNVRIKPGEKIIYNRIRNNYSKQNTSGEVEASWKDGKLIFHDTPFPEVLRMLEKRYNVSFVVTKKKILKDSFTGRFSNQRLDRVLEVFKVSSKIKWRYIDSKDQSVEKQKIEIY